MRDSDFEGPTFYWSMMSIIGAIATAALLIIGLEMGATRIKLTRSNSLKSSQVSSQGMDE